MSPERIFKALEGSEYFNFVISRVYDGYRAYAAKRLAQIIRSARQCKIKQSRKRIRRGVLKWLT